MNGVIVETEYNFRLEFRYNPRIIEKVKALPNRRYDGVGKFWFVPKGEAEFLKRWAQENNFQFQQPQAAEFVVPDEELPHLTIDIPLKRALFPFQARGVAYALKHKKVIVADQPGLGKTTQAFATIIGANSFPCLIICPSSLKINWQREIETYTHKKALILCDAVKNNWPLYHEAGLADFYIVNYESLKKYFVEKIDDPGKGGLRLNHIHFRSTINKFKSVIIDESHRVKSLKTQQTKFTRGICIGKEYILALTGTPVINKPKDLVSQLGIIDQFKNLGGYKHFSERYCSGPREASNLKELNSRLRQLCFYRRDKSEVLKDLPAKTRQVVYCDINTRREYEVALNDLERYLRQYKEATDEQVARSMRGQVMVQIGILKNIAARGKLKEIIEFIDDLREQGEKLVLFGHLKEVLGKVKEHYPDCVSITGDDNMHARDMAVSKFQNDPKCQLIVCSMQAAGVGLTLTASSRVAFIELPWTAAICDQCEDRCHRIGQHDNVTCTYFLGDNTIDQYIYDVIANKRLIADQVTGSEENIQEEIVDRLYNLFNQKAEA